MPAPGSPAGLDVATLRRLLDGLPAAATAGLEWLDGAGRVRFYPFLGVKLVPQGEYVDPSTGAAFDTGPLLLFAVGGKMNRE